MRRLLTMILTLMILGLNGGAAQADPIQLLSIEGGISTGTTVGTATNVGSVWLPEYLPLTLNDSSQGGTVDFSGGAITPDPGAGWVAGTEQNYTVNAPFYINLAALAPGSTDTYQGPQIEISGEVTGTLNGPGSGGSDWRWSGGYSGTATSVTLWPMGSQDLSQLPAPLLDIFNHPDHFHVNVTVTGGDMSDLDVTFTFDPPSPMELPEPTALMTLLAGSAALMMGRWKARARRQEPSSLVLGGAGSVAIVAFRFRRRRARSAGRAR